MEQSEHATIRDSLYDRIPLSRPMIALIETRAFLRLDQIQQLGFVSKVWPGAKHTRFEHSLGVMHLMREALGSLRRNVSGLPVDAQTERVALAAALLHDIGHYPYSHAIEELGPPVLSHEVVGRNVIETGNVAEVLCHDWNVDPTRVAQMIMPGDRELPPSDQLLRGLLSGTLDVDKLDYLPRDAKACNVPYGGVDTVRLLDSLRVAQIDGQQRIVIGEKGVSALHSLINARQEMFDNVYWHHTNRACMSMLLRAVQDALVSGALRGSDLTLLDDRSLIDRLDSHDMPVSTRSLVVALDNRRLHKRAIEVSARAPQLHFYLSSLFANPAARRAVEIDMCRRLSAQLQIEIDDFEILIDIPKPEKWKTDVWVHFERPPIGFDHLMHWSDVAGLTDSDFKRYEEHRRLIRVVTTERLREAVRQHWESLLYPLLTTGLQTELP